MTPVTDWDDYDDADGEYHDDVVHPTWVEGCGDCVARAEQIEAERRPCPEGCPGGHTEAEYYGGGCARRDQEAFEGWGPRR